MIAQGSILSVNQLVAKSFFGPLEFIRLLTTVVAFADQGVSGANYKVDRFPTPEDMYNNLNGVQIYSGPWVASVDILGFGIARLTVSKAMDYKLEQATLIVT